MIQFRISDPPYAHCGLDGLVLAGDLKSRNVGDSTMKALAVLLLIPLGGCSLAGGDLSALPAYAQIGSTILAAEMRVDLVTVSDVDLVQRQSIMNSLEPVMDTLHEMSIQYRDDVQEEIDRRTVLLEQ